MSDTREALEITASICGWVMSANHPTATDYRRGSILVRIGFTRNDAISWVSVWDTDRPETHPVDYADRTVPHKFHIALGWLESPVQASAPTVSDSLDFHGVSVGARLEYLGPERTPVVVLDIDTNANVDIDMYGETIAVIRNGIPQEF